MVGVKQSLHRGEDKADVGVGDGALVGVVDVFQVRRVRVGVTEEGHFRYGVFWDYFPDIDVAGLDVVFLHYF